LFYIEKGDLLEAIATPNPSAALISGTLEIYTHLVRGINGVMWEEPDEYEEETRILHLLINHLFERELSLTDLNYLSEIFNELYYWIIAEDAKWIKKADKDQKNAKAILGVYKYPPNKTKIATQLVSTDCGRFYETFEIAENMKQEPIFNTIFDAIKNASHPRFLDELARCITNKSQAGKAIKWAIDKYLIIDSFGPQLRSHIPGCNETLRVLIKVAEEYPGLGRALVLAGLNHGTTAHDAAANTLLKWPVDDGPDGALGRLDQAVKNTGRTLELLNEARNKHGNSTSETFDQ
jgi:hypothetical protein